MPALNYAIAANSDDAGSVEPAWSLIGTYGIIGNYWADLSKQGFRFLAVTIPPPAIITVAHLVIYSNDAGIQSADANIFGEDNAAPATFSTELDWNGRTRTAAFALWHTPDFGAWGTSVNTVDLTPIINELRASYDYSAGRDMAFLVEGVSIDPAAQHTKYLMYREGGRNTGLHLEYTMPVEIMGANLSTFEAATFSGFEGV